MARRPVRSTCSLDPTRAEMARLAERLTTGVALAAVPGGRY